MLLTALKNHIVEIVGASLGSASGILAMVQGQITIYGDLHAVGIAFLTGISGGLGALIIKHVWNKVTKTKNADRPE